MPADPFQINDGGGLAGDGTIVAVEFTHHEKFVDEDGNPRLVMQVIVDMDDHDDPWDKIFSCGNGWISVDEGRRAVREDKPDDDSANFNASTGAGRFIKAAVAAGPNIIAERYAEGQGVGATDAGLLEGLRYHFDNVERPKNVRGDDGKWRVDGTTADWLPVKFLGEAEEEGAKPAKKAPAKKGGAKKPPAKSTAKKGAKKAPAKAAPEPEPVEDEAAGTEGEMPEEIRTIAGELYEQAEGFDDWVEAIVEAVAEVEGSDDWLDYITEPVDGLWDEFNG